MKRAVDLVKLDITENPYNTEIHQTSQQFYDIYNASEKNIIRKCYIKAGTFIERPSEGLQKLLDKKVSKDSIQSLELASSIRRCSEYF